MTRPGRAAVAPVQDPEGPAVEDHDLPGVGLENRRRGLVDGLHGEAILDRRVVQHARWEQGGTHAILVENHGVQSLLQARCQGTLPRARQPRHDDQHWLTSLASMYGNDRIKTNNRGAVWTHFRTNRCEAMMMGVDPMLSERQE